MLFYEFLYIILTAIAKNVNNAAIRGWLTVFLTGIEAQGVSGQPVAPLIIVA